MKARKEKLERLVDDVVSSYHSGFNKAIHNYSEILRLFTKAQDQVDEIKQSLHDARVRLGSHSKILQQQWNASVMLKAFLETLDRVEELLNLSSKAERAAKQERFAEALQSVQGALALMERTGLKEVGQLGEVQDKLNRLKADLGG